MKTFSQDISLVLGGAAGQGIQTVEALLMTALKQSGYRVFASKEYMSRIRGGSNSTEIRISNLPQASFVERIDFLFAMDKAVVQHLAHRISGDTIILGEASKLVVSDDQHVIDVPFTQMTKELGNPIYTSTIAVGVALGLLGVEPDAFYTYLKKRFAKKGEEVVEKNLEAARTGYGHGKHIAFDEGIEVHLTQDEHVKKEVMMSGNDALGLGALAAGCNYISSYPMSPGTGLLSFLAKHSDTFGVAVDQAEDEIAAINQGVAAWYAGARAVVTTSGGGFALMCEGVSLAGMIETPVVVHVGMRPGPATGFPTRTEQADLNLVLYAGHGEFPRAIYAPGTQEEAFACMQEAFRIADAFQSPVFVLTDQFFLDAIGSFSQEDLVAQKAEHHIIESQAEYRRYEVTPSGISPRSVPGFGKGLVAVDSDEHDEEARITESRDVRQVMQDKRLRKHLLIEQEALLPTLYGDLKNAKHIVVSWGSNHGVMRDALQQVNSKKVCGIHFAQVFPLHPEVKQWLVGKQVVVMENNATGQFADLLQRECELEVVERILKYNGDPFSLEEVVDKINQLGK